ncbi:MAG: hypothetical protein NTX17_10640 [Candidatus Eisenbacteria bacterium]|nr:hypothetical protein [Candidatus Eisenbacteria bacterium]
MAIQLVSYKASFDLLRKELEQLTKFIEPVDANVQAFSHRTYGLLLRICTDFESLAKELLVSTSCSKGPDSMTIQDYRILESSLHLETVEVEFLLWRPSPRRVLPFKDWSTAQPPVRWYQDYNVVKHNREAEFSQASFCTVLDAMSGLFAMLAKASDFDWGDFCSWGNQDGKNSFWRAPFCMYWSDPS